MKQTIFSWGKYVLSVIGAAYFGLLCMVIATVPVRFFRIGAAERVVLPLICVIGSMTMLFFLTMKYGYDENTPNSPLLNKLTVIQSTVAVVVYILLTVMLGYGTLGAATNVLYLANVLGNLDPSLSITRVVQEHSGWLFLSLILQTLPFIPAMLGGYVCGGKKRIKSRGKLFHTPDQSPQGGNHDTPT